MEVKPYAVNNLLLALSSYNVTFDIRFNKSLQYSKETYHPKRNRLTKSILKMSGAKRISPSTFIVYSRDTAFQIESLLRNLSGLDENDTLMVTLKK